MFFEPVPVVVFLGANIGKNMSPILFLGIYIELLLF